MVLVYFVLIAHLHSTMTTQRKHTGLVPNVQLFSKVTETQVCGVF